MQFPIRGTDRCEFIDEHAINRYRERTTSNVSDKRVVNRLTQRIYKAREMKLKSKFQNKEIMKYGKQAKFYWAAPLMLVVVNKVMMTVHKGEADKWEYMD